MSGAGSDTLKPNESLHVGESLTSQNKLYRLTLQSDGNVVLYNASNVALWASGTAGKATRSLVMQGDGNLVAKLGDAHQSAVWATGSNGFGGAHVTLQNDGDLVLAQGTHVVWTSSTNGGRRADLRGRGVVHDVHHEGGGFDLGKVASDIASGAASAISHVVPKEVGAFIGNAVKAAGRAIGQAETGLVNLEGAISKDIAKIPVLGAPLSAVFDATFHTLTGPLVMAVDVAIKGERIDQALVGELQTRLQDFKAVGPYVQMVVSVVPGVGTGVSAALGAGLALANGQPIDQAILAGVSGALPGGPLARAAVSMAYAGVHAAVSGEKLDVASLGNMAAGAAADALNLPPAAKQAMLAGVSMAGQIAGGARIDQALSQGVIAALPLDPKAKDALKQADQLALDLAHGKPIDKALLSQVGTIANLLPIDAKAKAQLASVAKTGASLAQGASPEQALAVALRSGVADTLIGVGSATLPLDVKKAIQTGLAVGSGVVHQARKVEQLTAKSVTDNLVSEGLKLAAQVPAVAEARKLAGAGQRGFDIASGLLRQQAKLFDVTTMRTHLSPADQAGFDRAVAVRVGLVAHPVTPNVHPAVQAAQASAVGARAGVRKPPTRVCVPYSLG